MAKSARIARRPKRAEPVRASERQGFKLNVSAAALRDLMTEQCRSGDGWASYYTGTQEQLTKAGIPEELFARHERAVRFRANGQAGYIKRKGDFFELTLLWDDVGPWYHSAAHPALSELARMVSRSLTDWLGMPNGNEILVEKLAGHPDATDYRLPASKRFKFTDASRDEIHRRVSSLFHAIRSAEILPIQPPKTPQVDPRDEFQGNVIRLGKRA